MTINENKEKAMKTTKEDQLRGSVRENYGKIALATDGRSCCQPGTSSGGCCSKESDLSLSKKTMMLGYTEADLKDMPDGANMGLGCGNPIALAAIKPGDVVVDLGSGGGFDCFLAAEKTGKSGQVIGVDMTPEMISKARANAEKKGAKNVAFRLGEIEHLPIADQSVDIIISNCVINLSPNKKAVFLDAYRILKTGGRLAISDILATKELPEEIKSDLNLYCACVGGAQTIGGIEKILKDTGFKEVRISINEKVKDLLEEFTPSINSTIKKHVVSAYIEAIK